MRPPSYNARSVPSSQSASTCGQIQIAVAADDAVRRSMLADFVRKQRRMDAAEDDECRRARAPSVRSHSRGAHSPCGSRCPRRLRARRSHASKRSSVSSTIRGVPKRSGVAAASTYNHRGVITAVPNDKSLGLTRCTRTRAPQKERAMFLPKRLKKPAVATPALCDVRPMATPASAAAPQGVRVLSGAGDARGCRGGIHGEHVASGVDGASGTATCVLTSPVSGSGSSDGATGSGDRSIATSPPPRERSSSRGTDCTVALA